MQLESVNISRQCWGPNEGKMLGDITFKNPDGKIQLMLDDIACNKILALCAEGLVNSAQAIAKNMTASIISSNNLLEKPA
jgi:hypothetical protein